MTDHRGASKGERITARRGYRAGAYSRQLHMQVGTIELRVTPSPDGSPLRSLIKEHPETGRESLFISQRAYRIPGLPVDEA